LSQRLQKKKTQAQRQKNPLHRRAINFPPTPQGRFYKVRD